MGLLAKVLFLEFFGPDINTEMGVVIYMNLKHSPDYIDSKYIWIHGSNSLGSSVFDEIPFLAIHRERKRCGKVGSSPCYSQSVVIYAYQILDLLLQGFYWPKYHFWLFRITMITISRFF